MIGQAVILRLASQYTLAAISAEHSADVVDLRAFALRADGQIIAVDVPSVVRGPNVDQWQAMTWPVPPLSEIAGELMPASSLPLPPMPTMVIVRY